ncbi:MAG: T9SS type A sorting domain-containing protein, partial [Bacteroidota bacterium]
WVPIENTLTQDISWRRNVFRVSDFVDLTEQFKIRFVASDSIRPGENLDGGSLIEGGVDDVIVYDLDIVNVEELEANDIQLYPNPASNLLTITSKEQLGWIEIRDVQGRVLLSRRVTDLTTQFDVSELAPGWYSIQGIGDDQKTWVKTFLKE